MSAAVFRHLLKWFCEPRNPMWNVSVMGLYTFMSVAGSTVTRNITKNWRYDAGEVTCVDHDPMFLYGTTFEVLVALLGFFVPVVFFKINPGRLNLLLYIFEVLYIVQYLYPIRIVIRIFEVIQNWCLLTMRIFEVTVMAQHSEKDIMIRNFVALLIVANLSRIFAQHVLLKHYLSNRGSVYLFIFICLTLKAISIACFVKYKIKPKIEISEIYTLSLKWVKSDKIWFYIDFFIYLSGQFIFNEVIYPKILPSKTVCFVTLNNCVCCLANAIGSIIGSFIIILLSRKYHNIKLIMIGLILNLIIYAAIYIKLPTDPFSYEYFIHTAQLFGITYSDLNLEIIFPFCLGVSAAYSYIALLFLLTSVYTQEISSSYAIYEIVKKLTEKVLITMYKKYSLLYTIGLLSAFGVVGTFSVIAGYEDEEPKKNDDPKPKNPNPKPEESEDKTQRVVDFRNAKYKFRGTYKMEYDDPVDDDVSFESGHGRWYSDKFGGRKKKDRDKDRESSKNYLLVEDMMRNRKRNL